MALELIAEQDRPRVLEKLKEAGLEVIEMHEDQVCLLLGLE